MGRRGSRTGSRSDTRIGPANTSSAARGRFAPPPTRTRCGGFGTSSWPGRRSPDGPKPLAHGPDVQAIEILVLERLAGLFVRRGVPEHIRSDNGPEFTAEAVKGWLGRVGVKAPSIEPGSPWGNGCVESFNGKLCGELLDREAFGTLLETKVLTERRRVRYNAVRPHSSLGYRPPAPAAMAGSVEALT